MPTKTTKTTKVMATKPLPAAIALTAIAAVDLAAAEGESNQRPTFGMTAYTGGMLRVGGFGRPVVIDLAGLRAAPSVAVLLDHDRSKLVGQANNVEITARTIKVAGTITGDDEPAQKVRIHAKNGFRWPVSVGVDVGKLEAVGEDVSVNVNGRRFAGPLYVVRSGALREVSFVSIGADENASAIVAASAAGATSMNFEQWLQAHGVATEGMSDDTRATLQRIYEAEVQAQAREGDEPQDPPAQPAKKVEASADGAEDPIAQLRAQQAAEYRRIAAVQKVAASHPEILAKAVEEGWSANDAELAVLRASRPKAPNVITSNDGPALPGVLEAALCMAGGIENVEKQYSAQTLEAAHRRFRHGIGLQELFLEAAWANGYTGRSFRSEPEAVLRAAFSTISLPGILGATVNKFLLAGFMGVESVWQRIAATRPVKDFKAITSYRMTGGFEFLEVGPDGELKHGELGEESMTNQASTFGRMFSLSRRDIINDDLGALTIVPTRIGRGGALKLNKVFWTAFLANSSFFTAARGNYQDGAGTALGIAGLTAAEILFLTMKDAEGSPIGVKPKTILVPPALNVAATQLCSSLRLKGSTDGYDDNPHAGKYTPEVSAYLSDTTITGNSTAAWYLLASKDDMPVIEVVFLNGVKTPTVERADANFNILGVEFRGYFDFGVALQEYRGGVKSKGTA